MKNEKKKEKNGKKTSDMAKYINPYTDFGFKKLFGTEFNKELLIGFLNALLEEEREITDIRYLNSERLGINREARRSIFDVYCENSRGEKFIVEMQNVFQRFYKDRSVYYATFPIQEQANRGEWWDFELQRVYMVGILNFVFPDDEYSPECMHHVVKLMDKDDKHVFFDKLTFIYLEMPKFKKSVHELETLLDKWLYVLSNLPKLMERPPELQEQVFRRLFEQAEIALYSPEEQKKYYDNFMVHNDWNNIITTAKQDAIAAGKKEGLKEGIKEGIKKGIKKGIIEGRKEGRKEGETEKAREIALKMKQMGMETAKIQQMTGLSAAQIEQL